MKEGGGKMIRREGRDEGMMEKRYGKVEKVRRARQEEGGRKEKMKRKKNQKRVLKKGPERGEQEKNMTKWSGVHNGR